MNSKVETKNYQFRLYIAGNTSNCTDAHRNLKQICFEYICDNFKIEVIDLLQHPQLAKEDNILAIPMVIRIDSKPVRKVIGNLSNTAEVLKGLGITQKLSKL